MMYVLAALLGLCIGSFLNVIVARFGREEGILTGRSHCPSCKAQLPWHDLIPLASYLLLRGRCRFCRKSISYRYPLIEFVTALVTVLFVYQYSFVISPQTILYAVLLIGFLLLLFFDWIYFILPDAIIGILAISSAAFMRIYHPEMLKASLISSFLLSGVFAILYVVSRGRWVGFGDVKLLFLIGFAFGYPFGFLVVVSSIWIATFVGITLIVMKRATGKTALPFGAFLSAASIIFILYAHELQTIRWLF